MLPVVVQQSTMSEDLLHELTSTMHASHLDMPESGDFEDNQHHYNGDDNDDEDGNGDDDSSFKSDLEDDYYENDCHERDEPSQDEKILDLVEQITKTFEEYERTYYDGLFSFLVRAMDFGLTPIRSPYTYNYFS